MARFEFRLPSGAITSALQEVSDDFVKHVWSARRDECLEEIGQILYEHNYLPSGTTWEVWAGTLRFSTYKPGAKEDLAHYFHEGYVYGPNIPKWEEYVKEPGSGKNRRWRYARDEKGRKIGIGDPSRYFTPPGKVKYRKDQFISGEQEKIGVRQWTDAVMPDGPLFDEVVERCAEILRR